MKANNMILQEVNKKVNTPEWEELTTENPDYKMTREGNETNQDGRYYEEYTRNIDGAIFRKYYPSWLSPGSVSFEG